MELKIEHLSKQFKDKTAVNDVNLTLTPGVWGLLGLYSANIVLIVSNFLIVKSIICCKNQKHFNQFTMSLLFCVILFYIIFLPLFFPLSEFVNTGGTI